MGVVDMGIVTVEIVAPSTQRERSRFQVVPVPGVFTRGRWRCWDFSDENPPAELKDSMISFSDTAQHIINSSEPETALQNLAIGTPIVDPSATSTPNNTLPQKLDESSTIVVTSIRPAPSTPQHQPRSPAQSMYPKNNVSVLTSEHVDMVVTESDSPNGSSFQIEHADTENIHPHYHTSHSVPASSAASVAVAHSHSVDNSPCDDDSSTAVNVVAIDNKIEQAMDLVKTHLTFAVREEVEILRNTIVELESRVVNLEAQNQVLRKYVSADVLAQLPLLMAAKSNVQDDAHNSGEGKENAQ